MRGYCNSIVYQVLIIAGFVLCSNIAIAQQVGINILYPDSSAMLHVESTEKGFLEPRMTTAQRDAIADPALGLQIFNISDSTMQYFNGVCWMNTYQVNCDDCFFTLTGTVNTDTINRVLTDSTEFQLTLDQNAGTPQYIALASIGNTPVGMTVDINPNPQFSTGTVTVKIKVTPFTPAGTYPIIIQALCGSYMQNFIFSLTLTPCYLLDVNNSVNNYNAATDLYNRFPSASTTDPLCVVVTVYAGVDVTSVSANQPCITTGGLPAGSVAAIVNNGNIFGKGGDGGIATLPASGLSGAGEKGGDAIDLTVNTTIQNNFNIFAGGGGGGAVAFGWCSPNIPIIGPICLIIGSGGGGGAGVSLGGVVPGSLGITFYADGGNGTGGVLGLPGLGGVLAVPITQSISVVTVVINPNTVGGNGGNYGFPGTSGVFQVNLTVTANVPIIGPITVFNGAIPIPVPIPQGGAEGFAVKRNGNTTNIPDNSYNTSFLKGRVGN